MSIYLTGDTHGDIDYNKISFKNWHESRNLTKDDYLIILGDFGYYWDLDTHNYLRNFYKERPYTILWLDGNHENFDMIRQLPEKEMFGGIVQDCGDDIYHLMRGEIYSIDNQKILTIGGAASIDKNRRMPYVSWWPDELLSTKDEKNALDNLEKHDFQVDYVLTHTCPEGIKNGIYTSKIGFEDPVEKFLEHIDNLLGDNYKQWYFGHHHKSATYAGKYTCLFERILKLGETLDIRRF
jgi:predicted phosphodiesterase